MKRTVLFFACFLAFLVGYGQIINLKQNPVYKPIFSQTDNFDTTYHAVLERAFYEAKGDTLRLALINDLAYYTHTRNLHKALFFTQKGLKLAAQLKNVLWEGKLQITQGAILLRLEKLDSAYAVLQQAKTKIQKQDLPFLNTQLGYVMERRGLISEAANYALQSLKLGEELKDKKAIALAYSDLSNLFWKQSKFEKGVEYGLRSENIFKNRNIKDLDYSFTLYVVGNNYLALKAHSKALQYYKKAIEMSQQYGFYNNLADAYISLVDLHTILKQYKKAEEAAANAIKYAERLENNFLLMRAWLSVGKLQNLTKRPQIAIQSLQTCLKVATPAFGDEYFLNQVYKELGKAYAATGDFQNAHRAFLQYDQLKDSVFTAEADRRVAELQTQFEVAQKEATIEAQQTALQQQKQLQWRTYGVVALLAIILAGLYGNYRNNRRTSRQLEILNKDLELKNKQLDKRNAENELLLKEIHHRVKNNLEVVSSLLALQAAQINDPHVQALMLASQNRVQSMGILHQKLYEGKNLAHLEMKNYFVNLGESLLDSYNETTRVKVECEMKEIELDLDTALSVGLIANELVTNSLKYAFPKGQTGKISLTLKNAKKQMLELRVADDGIGKAANNKPEGTGFGTKLVALLIRQLEGQMQQNTDNGTVISIQFARK